MTNKDRKTDNTSTVALNEDRGLKPVSSGTPMPKVKPAKPATTKK